MPHDQLTAQASVYAAPTGWVPGRSRTAVSAGTSVHRDLEAAAGVRNLPGIADLINRSAAPPVPTTPPVTTFLTGACQ